MQSAYLIILGYWIYSFIKNNIIGGSEKFSFKAQLIYFSVILVFYQINSIRYIWDSIFNFNDFYLSYNKSHGIIPAAISPYLICLFSVQTNIEVYLGLSLLRRAESTYYFLSKYYIFLAIISYISYIYRMQPYLGDTLIDIIAYILISIVPGSFYLWLHFFCKNQLTEK